MSEHQDLIAGKNPVIEALKGGRPVNKIWIAEGSQRGQMNNVIQLAKNAKVNVQFVPKKKLDQMTESQHQGVVAQIAAYEYQDLSVLFERAKRKK